MSDCVTNRKDLWSGCGTILANRAVSKTIRRMTIVAPEFAERVQPGHFVMLRLLEGSDPVLGRPFAVFDVDVPSGAVDVVYAVVGKGTRRLAHLRVRVMAVRSSRGESRCCSTTPSRNQGRSGVICRASAAMRNKLRISASARGSGRGGANGGQDVC